MRMIYSRNPTVLFEDVEIKSALGIEVEFRKGKGNVSR